MNPENTDERTQPRAMQECATHDCLGDGEHAKGSTVRGKARGTTDTEGIVASGPFAG